VDEDSSGLEVVYIASGQLRAEVIRSKLEAAGIPVLLQYESLGIVMGLTVDGLGEVRVLVPAEYANEARALLVELEEPLTEDSDDFPEISDISDMLE
jgi:hypothetical protein